MSRLEDSNEDPKGFFDCKCNRDRSLDAGPHAQDVASTSTVGCLFSDPRRDLPTYVRLAQTAGVVLRGQLRLDNSSPMSDMGMLQQLGWALL